ncbi:MAG TPA: glycosyltransferase family 4 protein [Flavipsychrobacter sp.]|nr:glycosyltransferase family 4 protein [Flavipsychrobacter sp.]
MAKKITIICNSYPPEKGAAPTRINNLAKMLTARGHVVEVITCMPNYPVGKIFPSFRGKLIQKEKANNIKINRLWLYPSNSKNPLKRIASMFSYTFSLYFFALPKLFIQRPDMVIVSSPPFLSAYAGIVIARIIGSKAVLNVSDLWPRSALELGAIKKGVVYRFLEVMEKRMYNLSDAYIGQSDEILEHIRQSLKSKKKEFLYRNLQETSPYIHKPRPEGKKKIVYAGLLGVAQGVYDVCANIDFAALNVEFHIYGDGYEREKIEQLIADNPDRGIFYHNSISASEMPRMLSDFHATMVPLKTDLPGAVPSKIFMAMANAIPVFFSGSGEGAKIVKDGKIGWVSAPSDFAALEQNILKLVVMSDKDYDQMRANCKLFRKIRFNKETQDAAFDLFLQGLEE